MNAMYMDPAGNIHDPFDGLASLKHCTIEEIAALIMVDYAGRPPIEPYVPTNLTRILELADEVQDEVAPILLGRHLIELGIKPGKDMGVILKSAHEAQLDGVFNDFTGAMDWYSRAIPKI